MTTSTNPDCFDCIGDTSNSKVSFLNDKIFSQLNSRDLIFRTNNLPTMTLDEFAEKEKAKMDEMKQMEEEAKKNKPNDDSDDEQVAEMKTLKARDWDDWKDLHEKGGGNKMKR